MGLPIRIHLPIVEGVGSVVALALMLICQVDGCYSEPAGSIGSYSQNYTRES